MRLGKALQQIAGTTPVPFDSIRRHIPDDWIEEALHSTGTATIRKRRLPAFQVVWLVIGIALFRNRSIAELVHSLNLVLPGRSPNVADSAIPQARRRVGPEPLAWLFTRCADEWAHASAAQHRWRGLSLYGVDGTTMRIADSDENRKHFGGTRSHRGDSGYPLVRLVGLMALRSHLLASAAFGAYGNGEHFYAAQLWECLPDDSLTLVDKGFLAANVLIPLSRSGTNRHWLTRAKKNMRGRVLKRFGRYDGLVEMDVSSQARAKNPTLPKTWMARAITYRRKGFRSQTLLTSLLDPQLYLASEIVDLYHERWELELGYDEIKTELLDREETLRSKSPNAVTQEIWGILLAYNLVRLEMEQVAAEQNVEPTRISFTAALHLIADEFMWLAFTSPGAIPSRLRDLRDRLKRCILPPRRSKRSYPRAVKIKMSAYARKRPLRRRAR
jgi:hypothetical protein